MPYVDVHTIHTPTTGGVAPAAWGVGLRDNQEFFIDPPVCSAFASSAQSVANNTTTVLTAGSENFDNDSMHSTVTNTSRITIQTAGRYLFIATTLFAANASGTRRVSLLVDGTTAYGGTSGITDSGNVGIRISAIRALNLSAGQYVETTCLQTSGGNLNVTLEEFFVMFLTR